MLCSLELLSSFRGSSLVLTRMTLVFFVGIIPRNNSQLFAFGLCFISMGESNTVVSAYTTVLLSPIDVYPCSNAFADLP